MAQMTVEQILQRHKIAKNKKKTSAVFTRMPWSLPCHSAICMAVNTKVE